MSALERRVGDENTISKGGGKNLQKKIYLQVTEGAFDKRHENTAAAYIHPFHFRREEDHSLLFWHCLCIYRSRVDASL